MRLHMPADWQVPSLFTQRLGDSAGRQRAMAADGQLLLVLHEPAAASPAARTGRLFWRDAAGSWHSNVFGDGVQALKRHLADFTERADGLEKQWQHADSAEDYFTLLRALAPLHRTTRNLHATLQQARETVPEDRDLINLRDQVGEIERALELLHGDAKNGLDYTIAHQAEQQAERTYDMAVSAFRLNLLAAAFFPVATVSAIFSMNLTHGLEGWNQPTYFWAILGAGLLTGLVLAWAVAKKPSPLTAPKGRARPKRGTRT